MDAHGELIGRWLGGKIAESSNRAFGHSDIRVAFVSTRRSIPVEFHAMADSQLLGRMETQTSRGDAGDARAA